MKAGIEFEGPATFPTRKKAHGTRQLAGWLGPWTSLDVT